MKRIKGTQLFLEMLIALITNSEKTYSKIYSWLEYAMPVIVPDSQDIIHQGMWDKYPDVTPTKRLLNYILDYEKPQQRQDILDVGCGNGDFVFYCLEKYPNINSITGIDLTEEYIHKANQKNTQEKAKFFATNATELSQTKNMELQQFVNNKFHKIYMIGVFQDLNIEQFSQIFINCLNCLHENGTMIFHGQTINKEPSNWQEKLAANIFVENDAPNFVELKSIINQEQVTVEYEDITSVGLKICLERIEKESLFNNLLLFPFSKLLINVNSYLINFINKGGFSEHLIFIKKNSVSPN